MAGPRHVGRSVELSVEQAALEAEQEGRLEDAVELWTESAEDDTSADGAEAYLVAARNLARLGAVDEAHVLLERARTIWPGDGAVLEASAEVLAEQGFRRAAERRLERCLALEPGRTSAWLLLGRVRLDLDLPSAAVRALEECERQGGEGPELQLLQARAARDLGDWESALGLYASALSSGAALPAESWIEASTLFAEPPLSEDATRARTGLLWIDHALEIDPRNDRAQFVRGLLLELQGNLEAAAEGYRRAIELNDRNLPALTNLAMLCAQRGDEAGARAAVERALELERSASRRQALLALVD